ncbi:sulfotransferase domain-containing protein [Pseudohalocynthiibacter aestuariivivens]|jgi:Sulfotransferase domain|uniref:Sulfotransferase domain-containing protein n=1 Tax=Pseudohalocynthiibacter aestuariivivens TaxID=1591409 RepID=A0ABV5JEP7_9RHOB|nr:MULTISPECIES: sulfotransferase domain-containing protein [Pseudohalocynthiibacter]MBS9718365.1 sulfotransferase domain-containing protein [Pseudohalocynthiibacter aestuariivivens]MCK0103374.1 sulfotransferase domain-containing protein [Pseudohalocynthiibacter sp. F2068]
MKSIVWLASYPKSGNTWLRAFLGNYIFDRDEPIPINKLHRIGMGDASANAYQMVSKTPFDGDDPQQSAHLRHAVLQGIVNNKADVNLVKTHNENGMAFGVQLMPPKFTRAAVYIMRNPLDMIVSYASHYGLPMDKAIFTTSSNQNALKGGKENAYQFLGSWSNHVVGWTREKKFPVLTIRYEDMKKDPHGTFDRVIKHVGLPDGKERLEKAIRFSDFKTLSKQETESGFIENSRNQERFFRKGKTDQWKTELTQEQVDQMIRYHGRVMKKFGYLE